MLENMTTTLKKGFNRLLNAFNQLRKIRINYHGFTVKGIKFSFRHWKVGTKIMVLILMMALGTASVSVLYRVQYDKILQTYDAMEKDRSMVSGHISNMILAISDFLYYDRDNPDFYALGKSGHIRSYQNSYEEVTLILDKMRDRYPYNPINQSIYELETQLTQLNNIFKDIQINRLDLGYSGYGKVLALSTKMHALNNQLIRTQEPKVFEYLLKIKNYESNYLADRNKDIGLLLTTVMGEINSLLEQPRFVSVDKTIVGNLVLEYQAILNDIIKGNEALMDHQEAIIDANGRVEETLSGMTASFEDYRGRAIGQTQILLIFLAVGLILFTTVVGSVIAKHITTSIHTVSEELKGIAKGDGDLRHRLEIETDEEIGQLSSHFNDFVSMMEHLIKSIQRDSKNVSTEARDIETHIEALVASIGLINSQVQEISSGVIINSNQMQNLYEKISANTNRTRHIERETTSANNHANGILNKAEKGMKLLSEMNGDFQRLNASTVMTQEALTQLQTSSKDIDNIVGIIKKITSQTELLALNAAIEAARVGEVGKGFYVVAGEIRKLAEESKQSTESIEKMIDQINDQVDRLGHNVMNDFSIIETTVCHSEAINQDFMDIYGNIKALNQEMGHIQEASRGQLATNNEIQLGINESMVMIEQSKAATVTIEASVSEQDQAVNDLHNNAIRLKHISMQLLDEVNQFKVS